MTSHTAKSLPSLSETAPIAAKQAGQTPDDDSRDVRIVESVRIEHVEVLSYRVPQANPAQRGTLTNYLVTLKGMTDAGIAVKGVGEGQPRNWRTGDDVGDSWKFLEEVGERLLYQELPLGHPKVALTAVQELMAQFFTFAQEHTTGEGQKRPYRGTLLGIEVALLDLIARALGLPLARLLGQVRDQAERSPGPVSDAQGVAALERALIRQGSRYGIVRLASTGKPQDDLALLELTASLNRHRKVGQPDKPLWLDLNGALTRESADDFVRKVATAALHGRLPGQVLIEQPVPVKYGDHLPALQTLADGITAQADFGVDVRIMGDESVWDAQSVGRLRKLGGLRAVQIRPAQAGGLLPSIELANTALAHNPDTKVFLSRMTGASEITGMALRSLALALPRLEYATVDSVVDDHMALTASTDVDRGARRGPIESHRAPGLGVGVSYQALVSGVRDLTTFPTPPPPKVADGRTPTNYDDVDYLHPLGPNGSKGHLLEREALALGLSTTRFSKGAFTATDGVHDPLHFRWSRTPLSSAVSLALCTHKEGTRMRLQSVGVPVPQGRTFAHGDFDTARQFAKHIGYPVVVKPTMGVRGIGVVANIRTDEDLEAALVQMSSSKLGGSDFIVEKHISGRDYRIVVVGDKVLAAILREPASVLGDGQSTIAELMISKNTARRRNPHLWARPIKYDQAAQAELQKAGLNLDSVPAKGQSVRLNSTCSLSQGGDSIDVLDEMHPSILEASVRAVKAVPGMAYCGVDFLLEDHTRPLDEQDAGVCELNAHAAIGNCEYPLFGTPRPVAQTLMRACVDHFGLNVPDERADELALHLTIRGKVTGVGYRRWLRRRARQAGVSGWVKNVDRRTVEAVLVGPTVATTALTAATILGPRKALPTSYVAHHIDRPDVTGFDIVPNSATQRTASSAATEGADLRERHAI